MTKIEGKRIIEIILLVYYFYIGKIESRENLELIISINECYTKWNVVLKIEDNKEVYRTELDYNLIDSSNELKLVSIINKRSQITSIEVRGEFYVDMDLEVIKKLIRLVISFVFHYEDVLVMFSGIKLDLSYKDKENNRYGVAKAEETSKRIKLHIERCNYVAIEKLMVICNASCEVSSLYMCDIEEADEACYVVKKSWIKLKKIELRRCCFIYDTKVIGCIKVPDHIYVQLDKVSIRCNDMYYEDPETTGNYSKEKEDIYELYKILRTYIHLYISVDYQGSWKKVKDDITLLNYYHLYKVFEIT